MDGVLLIELAQNVNCEGLIADRGRAPGKAAAHRFEDEQLPALDAAIAHGGIERQRDRCRRCVGVLVHCDDDPVAGRPSLRAVASRMRALA